MAAVDKSTTNPELRFFNNCFGDGFDDGEVKSYYTLKRMEVINIVGKLVSQASHIFQYLLARLLLNIHMIIHSYIYCV